MQASSSVLDQVHMLSPVDGANNINPGSPITFVSDKFIDVSKLNKADITLVRSDGKTVISGQTTAHGLTYTFKPGTSLLAKTTYTIKLNAGLISQAVTPNDFVNMGSFTTGSILSYMIFATKETYTGDLQAAYTNESGGTAAADAICNNSESRPVQDGSIHSGGTSDNGTIGADNKCNSSSDKPNTVSGAKFKAILGSYERRVCVDSSKCGPNYQLDWALQPNTTYYNSNNESIATTTANSIFPDTLTNSIVDVDRHAWTGLTGTWENSDANCGYWSVNEGPLGTYGITNSTTSSFIYENNNSCGHKRYLYCAEQSLVQMTEPAICHRTLVSTDVTVKLAFPNDIKADSSTNYNLRLDKQVFNKKDGVSYKEVPSKIEVKNSREVEINPTTDLEADAIYRVTESSVINTAGNYEPGATWYFSTNINVAGPKLVNSLVESVSAKFTEVFPADTDISTVKPGSTVNLYRTSSTTEEIDNDMHVTGVPLIAVPFVIETITTVGGGLYFTYKISEALYPGEQFILKTHDTKNTLNKVQKQLRKVLRVIYETPEFLYMTQPSSKTDAPVNTKITLTMVASSDPLDQFDQINPGTVTTETVKVTQASSDESVATEVPIKDPQSLSGIISIQPKSPLKYNSTVIVKLKGVQKISGTPVGYDGGFKTAVSESPVMEYPRESTNVALNSNIIFKFSRKVDPKSVNSNTFRVRYASTTNNMNVQQPQDIPGTLTIQDLDGDTYSVTYTPTNPTEGPPLTPNAVIVASIESVLDQGGAEFPVAQAEFSTVPHSTCFGESSERIIYAATNNGLGYAGNLTSYDTKTIAQGEQRMLMGTSGADWICNNDPGKPPGDGEFRAIVGVKMLPNNLIYNRYPFSPQFSKPNASDVPGPLDWPVYSNTRYVFPDRRLFGNTDANGIFNSSEFFNGIMFLTNKPIWFGMNIIRSIDFAEQFWQAVNPKYSCLWWHQGFDNINGLAIVQKIELNTTTVGTQLVSCSTTSAILCAQL